MDWFYNLKISVKLLSAVVIVAFIACFTGFIGYRGMDLIGMNIDEISGKRVPSVHALEIVNAAQTSVTKVPQAAEAIARKRGEV